jgi:hypothetical protein
MILAGRPQPGKLAAVPNAETKSHPITYIGSKSLVYSNIAAVLEVVRADCDEKGDSIITIDRVTQKSGQPKVNASLM